MILISLVEHRHEKRIKVKSKFSPFNISKIKQIEGRKWSKTLNSWHIPYSRSAYNKLLQLFGRENIKNIHPSESKKSSETETSHKVQLTSTQKSQIKQCYPKFIINTNNSERKYKAVIGEQLIVNQLNPTTLEIYIPHSMHHSIEVVKKINGRKWDIHKMCWELPYTQDTIHQLKQINAIHFNFKISTDILKTIPNAYISKKKRSKAKKIKRYDLLNDMQKRAIIALEETLIIEQKSQSTIKSYRTHIIGLLAFYPDIRPSKITNAQLKKYLFHKIKYDHIHRTTQGQILNAFVAFFKRLLKQEDKLIDLYRPKKPKSLPNVFSKQELIRFLGTIHNLKHKTMMLIAYSGGLRRSELINLRKKDILFERKCIFVKQSKGYKDRYVMLADNAVQYIKKYLAQYQPKYWLFEGGKGGQYGERSIQSVFSNAKIKSGVNDSVTLHGLRHSFATHLVEDGVPLHVVKDLLGHNSIKTTEVYLHISKNYLQEIKSPLDRLVI